MGRRLPRRCTGFLEYKLIPPRQYRQMLAKGLKYVFPPDLWSSQLDCGDDDPLVCQMQRVFHAFSPDKMWTLEPEAKCLREFVGWNRGLSATTSGRVRRKRIRLYTNWIKRRMKKAGYGRRDELAGLIPFAQCVDANLQALIEEVD